MLHEIEPDLTSRKAPAQASQRVAGVWQHSIVLGPDSQLPQKPETVFARAHAIEITLPVAHAIRKIRSRGETFQIERRCVTRPILLEASDEASVLVYLKFAYPLRNFENQIRPRGIAVSF